MYNADRHHSFGDLVVHQVEDRTLWISDLAVNNRATFIYREMAQEFFFGK